MSNWCSALYLLFDRCGSDFLQSSMYFRPYTLSFPFVVVMTILTVCSFHFGISFAFHIEVPILVSKITYADSVGARHFCLLTARKSDYELRQ